MSDNLIQKSPLNIRNLRLPIAEAMLRVLYTHKSGLTKEDLSRLGMDEASQIEPRIKDLTRKGYEEIMELRRLGLIDQRSIGALTFFVLSGEGENAINSINSIGREKYFFRTLYEKEQLFKQFVDMLQRRGKLSDIETFEISGMSRPKVDYIKTVLRDCKFIAEFTKEGKTSIIKYVPSEPASVSETKRAIVENYSKLKGTRLFVTIDELWKEIQLKIPLVSEELFDSAILELAKKHIGEIELIQGVSPPGTKLLFDKRSDTYFHYLKIPTQVLEDEMKNGQVASERPEKGTR
jgi:hypothetical protein